MPYYRFSENDILYNELKLHPKCEFFIHSGSVYYNQVPQLTGTQVDNITHTPTGYVSLYEYNIDRLSGQLIYPFRTKEGSLTSFKTVTTDQLNLDFSFGDTVSGSYPLTASISRKYYAEDAYDIIVDEATTPVTYRQDIEALRNTLNYYVAHNPHYQVSSSYKDYAKDEINIVRIPSIFYGSSIEKGSVDFKFFISGSLAGRAQDLYKDGSLIQTWPTGSYYSGSNVGVVLYNEGFALLYDPPSYRTSYDLSFDGGDFLSISYSPPAKFATLYDIFGNMANIHHGATFPEPVYFPHWEAEPGSVHTKNLTLSPLGDPGTGEDQVARYHGLGSLEDMFGFYNNSVPKDLDLDPLQDEFTISAWVKTSASGPIIVLSGELDNSSWCKQYGITVASNKLVGYSGGKSVASSTTINDGAWHHVVMTSDRKKIVLYVDGAKESTEGTVGSCIAGGRTRITKAGGLSPNHQKGLLIGAALDTSVSYYNGLANEVGIWKGALTVRQVGELYNKGCPMDVRKVTFYEDSLLAWWDFEDKYSIDNMDYYRSVDKQIPYSKLHTNDVHTKVSVLSGEEYVYSQHGDNAKLMEKVGGYVAWSSQTTTQKPTHTETVMTCLKSGVKGFGEGHKETYIAGASDVTASWAHWGATGSNTDRIEYSSYSLAFNGTQYTPVITMFAYAPKVHLNHSNNYTSPAYPGIISSSYGTSSVGSYKENASLQYKNIVSSSYHNYKEPFSKQTYISKIGIYDENKNLIGTAKLATPLRKREIDEYIFKLKLDI